jgi:hypothetical protein
VHVARRLGLGVRGNFAEASQLASTQCREKEGSLRSRRRKGVFADLLRAFGVFVCGLA